MATVLGSPHGEGGQGPDGQGEARNGERPTEGPQEPSIGRRSAVRLPCPGPRRDEA